MKFELRKTISIIERTPVVLHSLLYGLEDDWLYQNEGDHTWCPTDVLAHLIICEKTNFLPRAEAIFYSTHTCTLRPIDMSAHFAYRQGRSLADLLAEFEYLRKQNIQKLLAMQLTGADLLKTGIHPSIGVVTISQLLATWAAHDLSHLNQITRVMAKQYAGETGPFATFITILKNRS